ncbi:hypothetical protein BR93DRAFT_561865 [Coniochaeta sp. PMI_546]|nr:hypothetical protein BR93DRAFT_561865 [Coniochaeta sp. PMI_546]
MALSALNKVFSSTSAKHLSGTTLIIIQKEDKMVKNIIKNLHPRDAMKAGRPAVPAEMADRHFGLVIRSPRITFKCKGINDSASANAITKGTSPVSRLPHRSATPPRSEWRPSPSVSEPASRRWGPMTVPRPARRLKRKS